MIIIKIDLFKYSFLITKRGYDHNKYHRDYHRQNKYLINKQRRLEYKELPKTCKICSRKYKYHHKNHKK